MKIGLDIMGGDFAPQATVIGAIAANKSFRVGQKLVLIGDKNIALEIINEQGANPDDFEFVKNKLLSGSDGYRLIGNAVPPLLAYRLGQKLDEVWNDLFLK